MWVINKIILFTFGMCILLMAIQNIYQLAQNTNIIAKNKQILVRKGPKFVIYNTSSDDMSDNTPLVFENSSQYTKYIESQKKKGIDCPNLFIQETIDAQGEMVYTIKIDPFNPKTVDYKYTYIEGLTTQESTKATHTSPYDRKMYMDNLASNIANSLSVNQIKSINKLELTKSVLASDPTPKCSPTPDDIKPLVKNGLTADPMMPNWGGVLFSQKAVEDGYYIGNEVIQPTIKK